MELDGRRWYIAFTQPPFGHKKFKDKRCVYLGPVEEEYPREGPFPYEPDTEIEFVRFYKDIK